MGTDYDIRMRIRAPRGVVFERLLRIEHLARWFCGWARIEPRVGGSFKFGGETCIVLPEGRGWETTIDEGETLRRFAFTWPIAGVPTRVAYELEDEGDAATVLRARHAGVPVAESTCGTVHDAWRICLGNLKAIAEGRSDGVRPDHAPVEEPEVRLTTIIEAPADRVFAALAAADAVDHWSTGGTPRGRAVVEPRPGGAFALGRGGGPDRVREIETNRRLVLAGGTGPEGMRVSFDLEAKASGTAVYLRAVGYPQDRPGDVLRDRGAWSERLVNLRNYVESGEAGFLDPYETQARGT